MSTNIKLKRSSVAGNVPSTTQLSLGELAINTADGKIYLKKDDGSESIVTIKESDAVAKAYGLGWTGGNNNVTADKSVYYDYDEDAVALKHKAGTSYYGIAYRYQNVRIGDRVRVRFHVKGSAVQNCLHTKLYTETGSITAGATHTSPVNGAGFDVTTGSTQTHTLQTAVATATSFVTYAFDYVSEYTGVMSLSFEINAGTGAMNGGTLWVRQPEFSIQSVSTNEVMALQYILG